MSDEKIPIENFPNWSWLGGERRWPVKYEDEYRHSYDGFRTVDEVTQQQKCLRGEHEADETRQVNQALSGSHYPADMDVVIGFGISFCRHCRCLFAVK